MKTHWGKLMVIGAGLLLSGVAQAQFTFTTNNGAITITDYTGSGGNVTIPSSTNGYPVTIIGNNAFGAKTTLTNVTIPNSVISIGNQAFVGCHYLTNVVFGNSVTNIGIEAFNACGLTSLTIPNSVTNIGDSAFWNCMSMTRVTIGNGVINIGIAAFDNCTLLTNVTIPDSVTSIGGSAFLFCSGLTSVMLGNSVASIGIGAFGRSTSLTNITVAASNPNLASAGGALFNKTLTALIVCPGGLVGSYGISNSVTSIGDYAFYGARLTNVIIPASVTSIGNYAFYYSSGLTSVTIPNSVTNVGDHAFDSCSGLKQAYFQGNAPLVNGYAASLTVFLNDGSGTVYYVPGTTGWGAKFGGWFTTAGSYQPWPIILGSGYGVSANNKFQFTTLWATNASVVVEASTNLLDWSSVITNTLSHGTNSFGDSAWTNFPHRFYRVRSP